MMKTMNRYILLLISFTFFLGAYAQGDVEIVTESDRSIDPAFRISSRPVMIDTTIQSPVVNYPLLVLQEETSFEVDGIQPATIRQRAQLSQLYPAYVKVAGGNKLMALGEIYYNSLRNRRFNWGVHGKHLSEWGKISKYAPAQFDNSSIKAFGKVEESRYSYGGQVNYENNGLHYYGFQNPNADRDSIKQRYQTIGFSGFFDSHKKDSASFNYRIGIEYENFSSRKPKEDSLKKWNGRENYVALKTRWQYNASTNVLLSNLRADLDIGYNGYRHGEADTFLISNPLDTGIVSNNTVVQLRPVTSFYGLNRKLHFKVGGEVALAFNNGFRAYLYPIAEVKYSLFNDIFIPYAGIEGGLLQQRFALLARENEFINSNHDLQNASRYQAHFGIKGTLSSTISFNAQISFANIRNHALFVNDTVYSSGNQFRIEYDTVSVTSVMASISYQKNEKLKIDAIGRFNSYQAKNNPYAWNLPQLEFILRGHYNVFDKIIAKVDFTLETGRYAKMLDNSLEGTKEEDGIYYKKLGVLADANIGVEYRYSKRFSIFANFNNLAAQKYNRWHDYPVSGFQFMLGVTFRF